MSFGFFACRRSFDPFKVLLAGSSVALACVLLAPSLASARPFAPQVTVGVNPSHAGQDFKDLGQPPNVTPQGVQKPQLPAGANPTSQISGDTGQTANIAPELVQMITRIPQSLFPYPNVPEPFEYGEQAMKDVSFVLPKLWRVNGEAMIEPCDLLTHLNDDNGNGQPDRGDTFDPDEGTPCSESTPNSLVGTVTANAFMLGLGYPDGNPLTLSGEIWYVRSDEFYREPGLGNHGPGSPTGDWSQFVTSDPNDKGNALPVLLAVDLKPVKLLGATLLDVPPIYIESSLQPGTYRIHAEIKNMPAPRSDIPLVQKMLTPDAASAFVSTMSVDFNPQRTETLGPFRSPPRDACSNEQVWDYSAQSYEDYQPTLFGGSMDYSQRYPDEGTLQTTTPPLTGCDSPPDPFDSTEISKVETSTTDAGANPALTLTMTRDSGDSFLKGMKMTFPEGMLGSPFAATELCSDEQAQQGECPAGSKVGKALTEVSVYEARRLTIEGDVYQAPTTGSELARFLTVLRTGPIADEQITVLPAYMYMLPGVKGIVADVPGMPTEFDVRTVSFTFDGSTGAENKHPLLINPASCNPVDIKVDFTSEMDQSHTSTAPYEPTNCDKLSFDPSFDVGLSCTGPHCLPGISMTISQPYGDAAMSGSKITIPGSFTLNLGSKVQPCSLADQAAETCPAESVMGDAVIESPLAIEPMQGQIFLAEQSESESDVFRRVHIRVTGLVDISMDAALKSNPDGGFDTVIDGIPQVPITKMQLNLAGGENALVYAPYDCGGHEFKAEFASHAGQTASRSGTPEISGDDCAPRLTASVSPRRAGAKSKLTLNVRPNAGTVLEKAKFDLSSLKVRGLGKSRSSRRVGKLTLTPKSGKRSHSKLVTKGGRKVTSKPGKGSRGTLSTSKTKLSLGSHSLSVKGLPDEALSELNLVFNSKRTKALRNPKKCGKVKIVGKFTDTNGQTYKTTAKARISCAKRRR